MNIIHVRAFLPPPPHKPIKHTIQPTTTESSKAFYIRFPLAFSFNTYIFYCFTYISFNISLCFFWWMPHDWQFSCIILFIVCVCFFFANDAQLIVLCMKQAYCHICMIWSSELLWKLCYSKRRKNKFPTTFFHIPKHLSVGQESIIQA